MHILKVFFFITFRIKIDSQAHENGSQQENHERKESQIEDAASFLGTEALARSFMLVVTLPSSVSSE
jgi:hypothetical protein